MFQIPSNYSFIIIMSILEDLRGLIFTCNNFHYFQIIVGSNVLAPQ